MKVLIIVDGLPSGGAERQIIELLRGASEVSGLQMGICTLSQGGEREREALCYADYDIPVSRAKNAGKSLLVKFPFILYQVIRGCRKNRPDIVHTVGCFSDIVGVVLRKMLPLRFINGSIRAARPRLTMRDRASQLSFPYADMIVANSQAGLDSFTVPRGRVVHNGVDFQRFSHVEPIIVEGTPVLCMVGNFTRKKDQARLIRCLPSIIKRYPSVKLYLIGRGVTLAHCEELARGLGCSDSVQFVNDCDSPEPYISAADVCYLITNIEVHGEGISNAIIEYMALGKPVIASECGGNKEIVETDVTGHLIVGNNEQAIIDSTLHLLGDRELRLRMGAAGQKRVQEKFSVDLLVKNYSRLYLECCEENLPS